MFANEILEATVVLDAKQAPIRTPLSRNEVVETNDDEDFDLFTDEEQQPDWVTSTVRLGSVRRRKSKKGVALLRIEKEIELEKQRHSELSEMREKR